MGHLIIKIDKNEIWQKQRSKGIGGSDCASVLGLNPYKTNIELWREKTGRKKKENIDNKPYVIYGKKAEEHLRGLFSLDYPEFEIIHSPYNIHYNPNKEYIRASLDGELFFNKQNNNNVIKGIWEGKTSEIRQLSDWKKWDGQIPMNYFCQILHYFAIDEDYKFAYLTAQIKHKDKTGEIVKTTRNYKILRKDYLSDIEYLIKEEEKFWRYVETDEEPPLILPKI
ncbi:MAG: YqaJ viral recombinase family protein [Candidatus Gastranaerophilales bacterium]|nr:YqaJ viral recombinase family protein [Candidatus Gastranaerophilales bacterium]